MTETKGMEVPEIIIVFSAIVALVIDYMTSESHTSLAIATEVANTFADQVGLPVSIGMPLGWLGIWTALFGALASFLLGIRALVRWWRFNRLERQIRP